MPPPPAAPRAASGLRRRARARRNCVAGHVSPPGPCGPRGDVRGCLLLGGRPSRGRARPPPVPRADVRGRTARAGPGGDVLDRHGLMGVSPSTQGISQRPSGQAGESWADGVDLGATRGTPPLCSAQGYCAAPAHWQLRARHGARLTAARARSSRGTATVHRPRPAGLGLMNVPQSTLCLRPRELCADSSLKSTCGSVHHKTFGSVYHENSPKMNTITAE